MIDLLNPRAIFHVAYITHSSLIHVLKGASRVHRGDQAQVSSNMHISSPKPIDANSPGTMSAR
ncbi:MAG: hypothetical protein ABIR27_00655 [Dokdonella sp.]